MQNNNKFDRRDFMIFKVLYQDLPNEIPVRERTKSLYIEAESVREVRSKLQDRDYNIEHISAMDEAHLEYEQKSEHFTLENV